MWKPAGFRSMTGPQGPGGGHREKPNATGGSGAGPVSTGTSDGVRGKKVVDASGNDVEHNRT